MFRFAQRSIHALSAAALTVLGASAAIADDTEIFRSQADVTGALPNVLFVIDTSGSMDEDEEVTPIPYDPTRTYTGSCNSAEIYYLDDPDDDDDPDCTGSNSWDSFPVSLNKCKALTTNGFHTGRAAQYRGSSLRWRTLSDSDNTNPVECAADHGKHGQTDDSGSPLWAHRTSGWVASSPSNSNNPWHSSNNPETYALYSGNWLNWSQSEGLTSMRRIDIVKSVTRQLVDSLNNVNIGLMRYSSNNQGGMITQAILSIDTNRSDLKTTVDSYNADGFTPLSETLYEAARYFKGVSVDYGESSSPIESVAASRVGGTTSSSDPYKSPIEYSCQKNYIVYLTDGLPTQDHDINVSRAPTLIGKSCDAPDAPSSSGWTTGSGRCADDIAEYLYENDISSLPGKQNVSTYTIGFGSSVASGTSYLNTIAAAGGTGTSKTATDVPSLTITLQNIFSDIQQTSATFVTPAVSVNAFNRTQIQNDLYFNVFKASLGLHWPGNLKKYRLSSTDSSKIVDFNGADVVGPDGFFADGTMSIWSSAPDGGDVSKGGAASRLETPADRPLYTNTGSSTGAFVQSSKALATSNAALTDAVVGAGTSTSSCSVLCQKAIRYARGEDVDDENGNGSFTDQRYSMGDPLHGKPGVVNYGGSTGNPDENDTVVFMPTNDGVLHAINGRSDPKSGGGKELWAFIPKEMLHRLTALYQNADTANRSYGLDGDIQVLRLDRNQNGIIESGSNDRVWLFFGMRMGTDASGKSYYYALDVTNRNAPSVKWVLGPDQLPGLGQTWSAPVITRVNVGAGGSANADPQKFVLIFGGGYDDDAESPANTVETVGNNIFMVDANTGARLWYVGNSSSSADLKLAKMNNSIPGRINVIDIDGDQFADRMYAGDLGGRVWRFDIFNNRPKETLVTGGVIAQFGYGNVTGATAADNRRFYNAPDVAYIQRRGADSFFNIAIGSGYRGHPLDATVTDRFYSLRDTQPFARWSQDVYNDFTPVLDSQMTDITSDPSASSVPTDSPGWKLALTRNGAGEKVLAEATTVNGVILFTTFQPVMTGTGDPCYPANLNRAYALSVGGGRPALDFNDDGVIDNDDLFTDLHQSGIAGEVNIAVLRDKPNNDIDGDGIPNDSDTDMDGDGIPNAEDPDANGNGEPDADESDDNTSGNSNETKCIVGTRILGKCPKADDAVRTFWRRPAD